MKLAEVVKKIITDMPPLDTDWIKRSWGDDATQAPRLIKLAYIIRNGSGLGVSFHLLTPEDPEVVLHHHDYFELAYLYSGSATQFLANSSGPLSVGDCVFLNPYVAHEMWLAEDSILVNICVSESVLASVLSHITFEASVFANYFRQMQHARDCLFFPAGGEFDEQIRALVEGFAVEASLQQKNWLATCKAYLATLMLHLTRAYGSNTVDRLGSHRQLEVVTEMLDYLEDHLADANLAAVAKHAGYSPDYASRLIRQHTGKRFVELIHDRRLERARELIWTTDQPLREIAQHVGFNDASYLSRTFAAKYGVRPSEYRH